MHISPIRLKIVPFAVATLLGGLATGVIATPVTYGDPLTGPTITLDAEYALGTDPQVDGMTDPSANIYTRSAPNTGADYYLFKSGGSPNNIFFHTYGFTGSSTYFGARASGEGTFFGDTRATFTQTFTNTTGVAQAYNFSFMVDQGEVGITGSGVAFANLMLNVKKDGNTVAQDWTRVDQDASGATTCVDNDFGLTNAFGNYMSCSAANAGNAYGMGGNFNVSMGVIGAGESFTLDYDIIATVSGELGAGNSTYYQACDDGYAGYAEFNLQAIDDDNGDGFDPDKEICSFTQEFSGQAIARSGDPFNGPLFGSGGPSSNLFSMLQVTSSPANAVPEPGSMALIGLGLAGVAIARRKKVAKPQ